MLDRVKIIKRDLISDERGWFLKVITGEEENLPLKVGEVYLTNGKPGQSKGGHYHIRGQEWFIVIKGNAQLRLKDVDTGEQMAIDMSFDKTFSVFVPSKVAHVFVNTGDSDFVVLAYSDLIYDPTDTIPYIF